MEHKLSRNDWSHLLKLIKEGSNEECCRFIEKKQLHPIQGVQSLNCLVGSVQYRRKDYSTHYLVKFINYLNIEDDIKKNNLKNYLLSVFHIVQSLVDKDDWPGIYAIMHLLQPFCVDINPEEKKLYSGMVSVLVKGITKPNIKISDEISASLLEFIICTEEMYNKDGLLAFLYKLISIYPKTEKSTIYIIDSIINNECQIFTKTNFETLMLILRKTIATDLSPQNTTIGFKTLIKCVKKLYKYATNNASLDNKCPQEVMDYLLATTELFVTVNSLQLDDRGLFMDLLTKINNAYNSCTPTSLFYLSEVVKFCAQMQNVIRNSDRLLVENCKLNFVYTKSVNSSLHAYISHAKSQAIIHKRTNLSKKCCCSLKTNSILAIYTQMDAFEYIVRLLSFVQDESTISVDIYMALHKLVVKSMEQLNLLIESGCKQLKTSWGYVCSNVYNFCTKMAAAKRQNVNILFAEQLVKGCFRYDEDFFVISEKYTVGVFYYLADCLVGFKRWDDAKDVCALSIFLFQNHRSKVVNVWNTLMYNCKSEHTLCDILNRKSPYMESICCDKIDEVLDKFTVNEKVDLYKFEIRNYLERYKTWPRITRCLDLLRVCLETSQKNDEFVEFLISLPIEVMHHCFASIKISGGENKIYSGVANFCLYKQYLHNAQECFTLLPKVGKCEKDDDDKNEQISHASNCKHIGLVVHDKFMLPLKQSLLDLTSIRDALEDSDSNQIDLTPMLLDLVIGIAHEFELQCYESQAFNAWTLAVFFSNKMAAYEKYIHAVSFLLKYNSPSNAKLIVTALKFADKRGINVYTKFTFYTKLATFYLKTDQLADFRKFYSLVQEMFYGFGGCLVYNSNAERDFAKDLATGYFALMIGAMEMLPCRDVVDEMHGCSTFEVPMFAWHLLLVHVQTSRNHRAAQAQLFTLFFNLGEHIVWAYFWNRMDRKGLQYAKALANHGENMICTYRVCRMFVFIGNLAIRGKKVEYCQVVVQDLEDILCCKRQEFDELANRIETGLMIRDSSPTTLKLFSKPEFLKHENCLCTPCTLKEHQSVLVGKYLLEALIAEFYKDSKSCDNFVNGCFSLCKDFNRKTGFYCTERYSNLLWTKIRLCRKENDSSGLEKNIHAMEEILGRSQYKNYYLFNDLLVLKRALVIQALQEQKTRKTCKTPEFRGGVEVEISPTFHTPTAGKTLVAPLEVQSDCNIYLEVPDAAVGSVSRTRLRGRRNLYAELQDSNTPGTGKTKGPKVTVKKTTRSTRKPMR